MAIHRSKRVYYSIHVTEVRAEVFQRLKEKRKVTKASVTRRINDIEKLLCVIDNFDEVIAAEKVLDEAMERFYRAHEDYHQILQTVEERQMSIIYLRDQVKRYQDFKVRITRYLEISRRVLTPTARSGEHLTDTVSQVDPRVGEELQVVGSQEEDHIQPHDSVSQVESRSNGKQRPRASQSRSGSSTASVSRASQRSVRSISVADERIRLAAEKAAMIVEASLLSEQDSLAQERLRLEPQERLLKLKTEIAKTEAKEKIYEDFEVIDGEYSSRIRPSSGQLGVKVEPSFRISTPHFSRDLVLVSHVIKFLLWIHALEKECLKGQKQSLDALVYRLNVLIFAYFNCPRVRSLRLTVVL